MHRPGHLPRLPPCADHRAVRPAHPISDPRPLAAAMTAAKAGPDRHGLSTYNNWGCRCEVCSQAKSEANHQEHLARKARNA